MLFWIAISYFSGMLRDKATRLLTDVASGTVDGEGLQSKFQSFSCCKDPTHLIATPRNADMIKYHVLAFSNTSCVFAARSPLAMRMRIYLTIASSALENDQPLP